jgi:MFS family permease
MNTKSWKITAIICASTLFSFYNLMLFSIMNVLGMYLMHDLQLTSANIGLLGSWDLWGNVIGFLPIGMLLDRYPALCLATNI